ncbi:MAG TPA: nucleoside triphosphate pyrophosphohydrolase [Acidimicrobiia bacterium]|nr:nucleoside triphosphate pyrophosphohydrolase [Acidimicrobiia bacterium]
MILIAGLGPAGLDRVEEGTRRRLLDPALAVVVRTLQHPAAAELAGLRPVEPCDDLYESAADFDEVYGAIARRVLERAAGGPVAYAVPGSPLVGERSVALIREAAAAAGVPVEVAAGESFLSLVLERAGADPLERGLQVLDGHRLPDPLLLHLPTVIAQLDTPAALYEVRDALLRLLPPETPVTRLTDLGGPQELVEALTLRDLRAEHAGLRVSFFLDPVPPGWPGLVQTNARLRRECPWDRRQTHHSLARHLIEEAYETVAALEALPPEAPAGEPDYPGYVEAEEELGDLLLQVVFHATLAAEAGVFGVEEVAEGIRRKLVRRHPHVFGEAEAETAEAVLANWEQIKQEEKGRDSLLDGVPESLPALSRAHALQARAATVGFDWADVAGVVAKVREELEEVLAPGARSADELGDLLFSVVNLARHLRVDPEQALRRGASRFERRFRAMEREGTLAGLTLEEMDRRWEAAKAAETDAGGSAR